MTQVILELDDDALAALQEAKNILGLHDDGAVMRAGVHEIIAQHARRKQIARFTSPDRLPIDDPGALAHIWRR